MAFIMKNTVIKINNYYTGEKPDALLITKNK